MDLSIEQLADLKIAIDKTKRDLTEVNAELKGNKTLNEHLSAENKRIESEIKIQAEIKENIIKENDTLRLEKQGISSEYEKADIERYEKVKTAQEKLDRESEILNARLIECDKRERDISGKNIENKNQLDEIRNVKKGIAEEKLELEKMFTNLEEEKKSIQLEKDKLKELKIEADTSITANNSKLVEIREIQQATARKHGQNNAILLDINVKEKYINDLMPKIEGFNAFLVEVKNFVLENGTVPTPTTIEEIEEMVETVNNIVTDNIPKEETPVPEENTVDEGEEKIEEIKEELPTETPVPEEKVEVVDPKTTKNK